MSDVQVSLSPLPVADARTAQALPVPEGDSGFQLLDLLVEGMLPRNKSLPDALPQLGTAKPTEPPITAPALPEDDPDPLAAWLEGSLGLSAHFSPTAAAPDPALPELPVELPVSTATTEDLASLPTANDELLPAAEGALPDAGVPGDDVPPDRITPGNLAQAGRTAGDTAAAIGETAGDPQATVTIAAMPARQGIVSDNRLVAESHLSRQAIRPAEAKAADEDASAPAANLRESSGRDTDTAPRAAPVTKDGDLRQIASPSVQMRDPVLAFEAGPLDQAPLDPGASVATQRSSAAGAALSPSAALHDPRPVMQQVAEAIVSTNGDRTEIALSPEELGRVRLIMSGPDRAHITVWAERPETLDLVRRNADLLTQHLAEAGVDSGSLNFRQDTGRNWQEAADRRGRDDDEPFATPAAVVRMSPTTLSDRRLDIRL
ncbi:flagellar hook-length control protein FliK [Paracoccus rhizosphaerae]|uniref:Flagellar hook-length control protein FliK n=1 Tax=Paracoccus rhizosphaerae TaxID=1133347 RepID=A0ABV6CP94_9RHOB|nr:flagellar hook-length control protein FliK [Paracoccus rhizosphaerae]